MAKTILEYDTVSLDEESGALVIICLLYTSRDALTRRSIMVKRLWWI